VIALLQRVSRASVRVEGELIGEIAAGLLAFIGVQKGDTPRESARLLERVLGYRMFGDGKGRMNLSVADTNGGLLLVPQFTLPADTRTGMRPGFSTAAHPEVSRTLFDGFVAQAAAAYPCVQTGAFGERMAVELLNEGPVTFWLEVAPREQ
jgi:D-tyrosyl-tRNA(Tyr) deacylase